jgi:hypothetical protein
MTTPEKPSDIGPATAASPTDKPALSEDRDAASRVALTLQAAEAVIRALADELTAELRAKGHSEARVSLWIGWQSAFPSSERDIIANIDKGPADPHEPSFFTTSIAETAERVRAWIAKMPDPGAADPWFDEKHPINRRVELCAWCGERPATIDAYDPPSFFAGANERVCEPCLERAAERQAEAAMEG